MSGGAEIYIEGSPAERRAVHLDADGNAVAIDIDRATRPRLAGAVYLARVTALDKRLGAAFLDIGTGTPALLAKAKDVQEGAAFPVQISRDAHDDKGPAATRQITLWGRYVSFQPDQTRGLQTARSLGQGKRRAETVEEAEAALKDPTGLTLRGPAAEVTGDVIAAEADRLRHAWAAIKAKAGTEKAATVLLEPVPLVDQILRDAGPLARIALDDRLDFAAAEALVAERYPDLREGLAFYREPGAMFETVGVADILETALAREAALPGGGRLTIEETRALTAIDVDIADGEAGAAQKEEALHRLNRRAAEEIGRQILLRRLSGLIVVDFAGFKNRGRMKALIDILRSRLKAGEGHTDVLGVSAAGLVEITRQRVGPSLAELCLSAETAPRPSPDAEAAEALRRVLRLTGAGKPVLDLSRAAAALLDGPLRPARAETEKRLGQSLTVNAGAARPDARLER